MRVYPLAVLLLLLTVLAAPAQAHRVNVFAWVEGGTVYGEAAFSGGKPAVNSLVAVLDAATGEELLSLSTDAEGKFSFPVPKAAKERGSDLKIALQAGMGHADMWVVKAAEFGAARPEGASKSPTITADSAKAAKAISQAQLDELSASVRALERQVGEMAQILARQSDAGPGLREILGGIGYILGLIGVAAYVRSRAK
jgi:nickel transport protein